MSATQGAFGLRPINYFSGLVRPREITGGISAAFGTAIYQGTGIAYGAGTGVLALAANAADWIGAFAGVSYTDSNGRTQYSKMWPASQATQSGTIIRPYVWDDPNIQYEIQTDATVTQANALAGQFNFSSTSGFTVGAGNATTQQSTAAANATAVGTGNQGMMRCLDVGHEVDNAFGDAFVILVVEVARHQFTSNKVSV